MNLKIGETIKNLRAERRVTQEQLSSFPGVTPQAISRWEAGSGYPDIETLPYIAEYFGVSIDTLLGVERSDRARRLREIYLEIQRGNEAGENSADALKRAREYAAEFPYDERILENLAGRLSRSMWDDEPNMNELTEAERILQTLAETTKDNDFRNEVLDSLTALYGYGFKDNFKAQRTILRLPAMKNCRERIASDYAINSSDDYPVQDYIEKLTDSLGSELERYILNRLPGGTDSWDKKVEMLKFIISIYKFVFGDELNYYNCRAAELYRNIACYKLYAEKYDEALDALESMCGHVERECSVKSGDKFNSPCTNMMAYPEEITPFGDFHTTVVHNNAWYMLNQRLAIDTFDPIRESGRFKSVIDRLEKIAF